MSRICTTCDRIASDNNLFCVQTDCPKQTQPIFGHGVWIGDLRVVRMVYNTNLAHFYEATRQSPETGKKETCFVKVAHHNNTLEDTDPKQPYFFLINEANFLFQIQKDHPNRPHPRDPNHHLNMLPRLLLPYANHPIDNLSPTSKYVGTTTIDGRFYRYIVFEWIDGNFLTDKLAQNPQPYFRHAGRLIYALLTTLQFLYQQSNHYTHLNLNPSAVFIRSCTDAVWRPVLLDLGFIQSAQLNDNDFMHIVRQTADPRYTYHKLLNDESFQALNADLYSLGMLLYTMLAGKPFLNDMTLSKPLLRQQAIKINPKDVIIPVTASQDEIAPLNTFIQTVVNMDANRIVDVNDIRKTISGFEGLSPIPQKRSIAEWTWQIGLFLIIVALSTTLLAVVLGQLSA